MKEFFKKLKETSIPRLLGVGAVSVLSIIVAVWLLGFIFRMIFAGNSMMGGNYSVSSMPMFYEGGFAQDSGSNYKTADSSYGGGSDSVGLSVRNIMPPQTGYTTGDNAESFEVTDYSSEIRTRDLDGVCGKIENLKPLDYVVFENSRHGDNSCSYVFKVKNDKAGEILAVIKSLKPETLQTSVNTIKKLVDDYTSETEILQKKLTSIEKTLTDAQSAYDQISDLATKSKDVESLAKIIDSKMRLIERLSTERLNTKNQIDRLNRTKEDQLDRLDYTFFRINVYENLIVNLKNIKNSWIAELKNLASEINGVAQDMTVNLASYVIRLIQIAVYLVIALFIAKYGWRLAKKLWQM